MNGVTSSFIFCGQAAFSASAAVGAMLLAGPAASVKSLLRARDSFVSSAADGEDAAIGAFVSAIDEFMRVRAKDDPRAAGDFMRDKIAKAIEQMGDRNWARAFGDLPMFYPRQSPEQAAELGGRIYTRDDIDDMVQNLEHGDYISWGTVFQFLRNHLPLLLEKGLFTPSHYKMIAALCEKTNNVYYHGGFLRFLSSNLPLLIERQHFTEKDCRVIVGRLGGLHEQSRLEDMQFLSDHLALLIETGIFTAEHCRMIIANVEHDDAGVREHAHRFLNDHLPLLVEKGMTEHVGLIVFALPNILQRHFHRLFHHGLIGQPLLNESLRRAGLCNDVVQPLASVFLASQKWMASPVRWLHLLLVLKNEPAKAALAKAVSAEYAHEGTSADVADISTLISFLAGAEPYEATTAAEFIERIDDAARGMRTAMSDTAQRLGLQDNPHYLAVLEKASGRDGERLLADWALEGMDKIWDDYKLSGDKGSDKKTRNRFKNFLEQASRRENPSISKLVTKRGYQAVEAGFANRLKEGADGSEASRIDALCDTAVWNTLKSLRLYHLLIKASKFMNPKGMASMRRLILGLRFENGKLIYPRYDELADVVGGKFLKIWREEYSVEPENLGELDGESGKEVMKAQVLSDVGDHMTVREGFDKISAPGAIRDLPEKILRWKEGLETGKDPDSVYLTRAEELLSIFEAHYNEIRKHLGDTFANIRTNLKSYVTGMTKGVRIAKTSERFEVTGDIGMIARSGSDPVTTCQNLEFAWVNQDGQPIHRMIHGQIKIANWLMDGAVMARHMLELTLDGQGREHILVDRLYSSGGFGRVAEMNTQILKYAARLGITEDRVHFAGEASALTAPMPMITGDNIYRDTFTEEGWSFDEIRAMRKRGFSGKEESSAQTAPPAAVRTRRRRSSSRWQTMSP